MIVFFILYKEAVVLKILPSLSSCERNSLPGSKTAKVKVQYQDDSPYSFKELEKERKPKELRFEGVKVLSETENGVSRIIYLPNFMHELEAEEYMTILNNSTTWYDKNIVIHGQEYPQPRLVAWYGPLPYSYSGTTLDPKEMPSTIYQIKDKIEDVLKEFDVDVDLNSVLLNLYRHEKDSIAWHSDDESSMGICPTIASVSLGAVRRFEMRPKFHVTEQVQDLEEDTVLYVNLTPGSLIIMDGCMQKDWQHRVPKEYHDKSPRINLTFRTVYPVDELPPNMPRRKIFKSIDNAPVKKTVHQQELNYDSESFPPLEVTVTYKKHQKSKNEEVPNPSSSSISSKDEEVLDAEILSMEHSEYSSKNQNNLNKKIDSSSMFESSQYHYDEQNNFNLTEPEESSGSKFSPSDELMDESSSELDISQTYHSNATYESADQCTEINISGNNVLESKKTDELPITKGSKSQLNANAPDFIPHAMNSNKISCSKENVFYSRGLLSLAKYGQHVQSEEIKDFTVAILDLIHNEDLFLVRDWYELETYSELLSHTLSEKSSRVIISRICSMILYAYRKNEDTRITHRYSAQRSNYSGNFSRPKKTDRPSTGRRY
ncbi:alpha-ketoglutarate-dependent dioxygenase alkB homolog 3 [Trichonephila inaurata madagascariensis]|uniref:Alpha-ketoglutarate-dependent dioxygenase alkB homolog 3 n=1 Tax=Trichonephila inaurata madagascariensis TaxID=2747483 RepID=A0A8X6JID1_9ARAC|nr:alpha-ketoglutarate-dependent dioxygenase alkB homolog 3 [Trichonephila inaurata madagascariensis]